MISLTAKIGISFHHMKGTFIKVSCIVVAMYFMASCNQKAQKNEAASDTIATANNSQDTLQTNPATCCEEAYFDASNLKSQKELSAQEIQEKIIATLKDFQDEYYLSQFFKMDSLKKINKLEEYKNSLGPGDIENIKAVVFDTLKVYNKYKILLWGFVYESFPACPSYSGTNMYATTFTMDNNQAISTLKLLQISSGADPPSHNSNNGFCKISNDGNIICADTSLSCEGSIEEPQDYNICITEITDTKFFIQDNGVIKRVSQSKSKPLETKEYLQ
ncbi:MAG: hypothetical protein NZ529_06365 [Cytophagaceae bacterium]|nr:hypothetical protein [Cytophagaceae bacterium]MDW8456402.1 hypothetical protein [Cytophagaceae bacterium]